MTVLKSKVVLLFSICSDNVFPHFYGFNGLAVLPVLHVKSRHLLFHLPLGLLKMDFHYPKKVCCNLNVSHGS